MVAAENQRRHFGTVAPVQAEVRGGAGGREADHQRVNLIQVAVVEPGASQRDDVVLRQARPADLELVRGPVIGWSEGPAGAPGGAAENAELQLGGVFDEPLHLPLANLGRGPARQQQAGKQEAVGA